MPSSVTSPPTGAATPLRRQLWRTGALVVGGSVLASAAFAHLSFTLFGTITYRDTMIFAVLIPLVVASSAYAWIAALTLRLEASRAALEQLAHQDPLTGLANRRAALQTLAEWGRTPDPMVLAIADLDFFKHVNDRLGHEGGDAGLIHLAGVLRKLVPSGWLVARIGGEEFLLAARELDPADFAARIEAVRAAVAMTPLITSAGPWYFTASFGLAARLDEEAPERLMSRADKALYAAKQAGRNRIEKAA